MTAVRYLHTATLLWNGKVLVAGGVGGSGYFAPAELYDPATDTWTDTGSILCWFHTATLLPNGMVLVAGGLNVTSFLASAELYDPAAGAWTGAGSMTSSRFIPTATLLPNGKVLVAGGNNGTYSLASAELYGDDPPAITLTPVTRQQGTSGSALIATVSDAEDTAGSLGVAVQSANPSNGVTLSGIANSAGNVTADVAAACTLYRNVKLFTTRQNISRCFLVSGAGVGLCFAFSAVNKARSEVKP